MFDRFVDYVVNMDAYLAELVDKLGSWAYGAIAADAQEANPPVMPTDIRLTWPAIRDDG